MRDFLTGKKFSKPRAILGVAAAALLVGLSTVSANAVPIASGSQINITGFNILSITSSQVIFTATKASAGGETGSFLAFGACSSCITMTSPITYSPFTSQTVYTGVNGLNSTAFTLTSQRLAPVYSNVGSVTNITLVDNGTATLTGFDPTPGIWTFTGNTINGLTGSFSATASVVPEPLSVGILGMGLLGLGYVKRQRSS